MGSRFEVRRPTIDPAMQMDTNFGGTSGGTVQGSRRRSLAQMTREALPRLDNYRNLMSVQAVQRPTLEQLYEGAPEEAKGPPPEAHAGHGHVKLGWIQGVLISVALNIWGVMLFLRVSWVVGQAGIGLSILIVLISTFVCTVTTLSLSAISTNGEIKGGGIYYIISRSLGPEFGASVGVVFAFANTVSASMNTIGFCDSFNMLLKSYGIKIIDNSVNDTRIIGTIALVVLIVICAVGMDYEVMAQDVFAVVIISAIVDYVVGAIMGPQSPTSLAQGFVGLKSSVYAQNIGPGFRYSEGTDQNFFTVFSIFFTSVTGVQAGANISGDLKNPESAIPKGTLLAIAITMTSYLLFVLLVGGGCLREASGNVGEIASGMFANCTDRECKYGLYNDYNVMQLMSAWGPWIYAGCFAATLSTAMTNLLSVPRIIQCLGFDGIYPGVIFFSKGYGDKGEPYRGYVLTLLVAEIFLLIADLNAIANLVSNFYLAAYAFINFCTFHAAFVKPLGWRPSFTFYNKWLSLAMTVLCVVIMFLIDWRTALITIVIIAALYFYVAYRKPDVNWGATTQAQTYNTTLSAVSSLTQYGEHVKNYRPQILVLAGHPTSRPALLDFANLITKNLALLVCGHVSQEPLSFKDHEALTQNANQWFRNKHIRGFYSLVDGLSLEMGTRALLQATGIGKMKPNILLMGYRNDWTDCSEEEICEYFDILHDAFTNHFSIAIVRLKGGFDYSMALSPGANGLPRVNTASTIGMSRTESEACFVNMGFQSGELDPPDSPQLSEYRITDNTTTAEISVGKGKKKKPAATYLNLYRGYDGQPLPETLMGNMTVFERKQGKGTIDVWWLYDDGGLTLLLPYLLSTRKKWHKCKMRVFALVNKKEELEVEERNIASLLSKFRIDYSSLTMVHDVSNVPNKQTIQIFEDLIEPYCEQSGTTSKKCTITDAELSSVQSKTYRQLRIRELMQQHSKDANMIVMTMPMPRKGVVSAPLYLAWLEVLTRGMPPFLLVRGNQTSVLTFYS